MEERQIWRLCENLELFFPSPRGRDRRGLGLDRSRDPLRRTHSSCGSDTASPGRRRCSASRRRIAPSSWCHRRTWAEQRSTRARLACRLKKKMDDGPQRPLSSIVWTDQDQDCTDGLRPPTIFTKAEMKTRIMLNTPTRVLLVRD